MELLPSVMAVLVAGLLVGEARGPAWLRAATKPLASLCFLAYAIHRGALGSTYGQAVFVALVFSWFGDVLLLGKSKPLFGAGLGAFLLGHVAYVVACVGLGLHPGVTAETAIVVAGLGWAIHRWLGPSLPPGLKAAVYAYIVVIGLMVIAAFGAWGQGATPLLPLAAVLFFVSDLFVARNRFITPAFVNRGLGLPLYYGAQILFCLTI